MQDRSNAPDRAEQIAALQRLLAQALESGVSARSMEESLHGGHGRAPAGTDQPGSTP